MWHRANAVGFILLVFATVFAKGINIHLFL